MLRTFIRFAGYSTLALAGIASAQTQAQRTQTIRAGVVVLAGAGVSSAYGGQPMSAGPYAFYNLQNDRTIKPASWNLENPNGPSLLTPDKYLRWSQISPTTTPPAGTRLTKANAAYWEVDLSTLSESAIARYDVLLVNPYRYAILSPVEREKLRRFVDGGGLLWIDAGMIDTDNGTNPPVGAGIDWYNNFPLAFRLSNNNPAGATERNDYTQPILSNPQTLTSAEITILNRPIGTAFRNIRPVESQTNVFGGLQAQFLEFRPITMVNAAPTMSLAHVGDGLIVVTSRGPSIKLNRVAGNPDYASNHDFAADTPTLDGDGRAAAKLAVNMINLLTEYRQQAAGSRKTTSSAVDLGAPLLLRSVGIGAVNVAPTVYKGMVIAVIGNQIVAYDADPSRDLDGDGDPDDGIPDYNLGGVEDVVWRSEPLANLPLSTPVCADVPGATTSEVPTEQVLVVDGRGNVQILNLAPKVNGVYVKNVPLQPIVKTVASPGNPTLAAGVAPNPVTVHEGLGYVCDRTGTGNPRGRVWVVDLFNGELMSSANGNWILGGASSQLQLPPYTQSATLGYIPIFDNSGGVDKVLYAPFASSTNGVPSAGFSSLWLGVRGEKPSDYEPKATDPTSGALTVTTRASQQGGLPIYIPAGLSPFAVKLTILDANGRPISKAAMDAYFGPTPAAPTDLGGGVLSFPFAGGNNRLAAGQTVRIDYTLDLGLNNDNQLAGGVERGRINLPDTSSNPQRVITGPIALAPNGNIFMSAQDQRTDANGVNHGGVFGFREEGRGLFPMILRYELFRDHTIALNGGLTNTYTSSFADNDPFRALVSAATGGAINFSGVLSNFRIVGSPIVRNDQVLVSVSCAEQLQLGFGSFPAPATLVMAFRANPDVPQVMVGQLPEGSSIIQPDAARSTQRDRLEVSSTLAGANFNYNSETGIVRFENLSSIQKGVVQQSLSQSQPLIIRRPGQQDLLLDPNSVAGNKWSPLLWYGVIQGLDSSGTQGPVATGDTMFIPGGSMTPSILGAGSLADLRSTGILYAVKTNVGAGNAYLVPDPARPWMSQFVQFKQSGTSWDANPGYAWPLSRGVDSFESYVVRLRQATLSGRSITATKALGVVGGDGALMSWGDAGLFTFSQTDFLVADEGRLAVFDPAGNLTWSTSASGSGGVAANIGAVSVNPLQRPTRAYRLRDKSYLTVDPGSSRVAVIDPSGVETRTITRFDLDATKVPAGYTANEPLDLSGPSDVLMYTSYESWPNLGNYVTRGDGNIANEYWVHYLVADSGNKRLIELVDRYQYNPNLGRILGPVTVAGAPQLGMLVWHSPATVSGKEYSYNSVSRIWVPSGTTGRYVYVAGVGSRLPTRVDTGLDTPSSGGALRESADGSGGIVIFDPNDPRGVRVINQIRLPGVDANVLWDNASNSFASPARPSTVRTLGNITSVTTRLIEVTNAGSVIGIMVSDGSGVYEMTYPMTLDPADPEAPLDVVWMMPNEVYEQIRRLPSGALADPSTNNNVPLRATFARRLDSGDVLIVNGYFGSTRSGKRIGGEIIQLDGKDPDTTVRNLGYNLLSITYELPPISGARGLVIPVFADRK